jgi:hypothetical protein
MSRVGENFMPGIQAGMITKRKKPAEAWRRGFAMIEGRIFRYLCVIAMTTLRGASERLQLIGRQLARLGVLDNLVAHLLALM